MNALLGVQTHYSFHWGTASPSAWVRGAAALGYGVLGVADFASLAAWPELLRAAGEQSVADPARSLRLACGATFPFPDGASATVWVLDAAGYAHLCEAITRWTKAVAPPYPVATGVPVRDAARFRSAFGLEDGDLDAADANNTNATKGTDGVDAADGPRRADGGGGSSRCGGLTFVVDGLDAWRALRRAGAETYWRVGKTLALPPAGARGAPCVFMPDACMLAADDFPTHRILRAVGGGLALDAVPNPARGPRKTDADIIMASPGARLLPPAEYADRFAVFADAIDRADALADRLAAFAPDRTLLHPPLPPASRSTRSGRIASPALPAPSTPDIDEPGGERVPAAESVMDRLRRLAYEGAAVRYGDLSARPQVAGRLEHELALIEKKGFAEYFLVVEEIVARLAGGDARERVARGRSVTCGRGSGAASLVNYCLGVTNVDVLKHDLLFERFLNEGRADPPDIDVDFAWDERDDVLDRVFVRFGDERVARVANHNRYDIRGALRAVARAFGFADPDITRRMKELPQDVHAYGHRPSLKNGGAAEASGDWDEAVRLARRLVGIPHGFSMHCGGVVFAPDAIARHVPTFISNKGLPTIQWEKDGTEDMGLVKLDLLGNRSLAVIRDAVRAIARDYGLPAEKVIASDPTVNAATQKLLMRGDTFGVFYMESPAMRLLLAKARQGDFEHAVIHSSIIRPAAVKFIRDYLERLHGKPWEPLHPRLDGVFDETYGVPVYQEDVVKLAMHLAGWDYARADGLRKALGKRDAHERLSALWPELSDACRSYGVGDGVLKEFHHILMSMTGYSFCKPHSASYAQVSYEAAYLRAHYPAYFIAAVLSNGGGFYSAQAYVSEAMRMGLRVLGPDVNRSDLAWRAEGPGAIRTGLSIVAGLTKDGAAAVVAARAPEAGGVYTSLADFQRRTRLHADDDRRLALVGAFDELAPEWNRPQILWTLGQLARETAPAPRPRSRIAAASPDNRKIPGGHRHCPSMALPLPPAETVTCPRGLFDPPETLREAGTLLPSGTLLPAPVATHPPTSGRPVRADDDGMEIIPAVRAASAVEISPEEPALRPPRLPAYSLRQRQEAEYAALGFLPGGHPMSLYEDAIRAGMAERKRRRTPAFISAAQMNDRRYWGQLVTLLGWPVTAKIVETKHGDPMIFQSFEDWDALCEAVLFPKEFQRYHRLLVTPQPLWVTGRVEPEFDVPSLHVLAIQPLAGVSPG